MALSRFLALNSNAEELTKGLEEFADTMRGLDYASYGAAKAAFRDIRDILMASARQGIVSGKFAPLSEVTVEYKERKGLRSAPLQATGNLLAGLDGISGGTWAKALRGTNEWYAFLHDRGRGFSNWSVEDRAGKRDASWYATSGRYGKKRWRFSRKKYKEAAKPGSTQFPQRQFMVITESARASIIDRYQRMLSEALDHLPKGNVPLGLR